MKGASKAKVPLGQIAFVLQVLKQLSRRTDNEAVEEILCTHKWYLESGRADWSITQSLNRMQTVDPVIRDLK